MMKHQKRFLILWLLVVLCITTVAPNVSASADYPGTNYTRPPIVQVPRPPILIELPERATPAPEQATAAPEQATAAPQKPTAAPVKVSLKVDKVTAAVGDTLTFKGRLSGGSGKKSMKLQIFKDGEKILELPSNSKFTWTYQVEEAGTYHGLAIAKVGKTKRNRESKKVVVTAPIPSETPQPVSETPQPMSVFGLAPKMWIESPDEITVLEGGPERRFPVRARTENDTYFKNDITVSGLENAAEFQFIKVNADYNYIRYERFQYMDSCEGHYDDDFNWVWDEDPPEVGKVHPGNPHPVSWEDADEGHRKKTIEVTVKALCVHPEGLHEAQKKILIHYLRDANRNGIADIIEGYMPEQGGIIIDQKRDIRLKEGAPIYKIRITTNKVAKLKADHLPKGLSMKRISGTEYEISGTPSGGAWNEHEFLRKYRVRISGHALMDSKITGEMFFNITLYRNYYPDENKYDIDTPVLVFSPIPAKSMLAGLNIIPFEFSVFSGGDLNVAPNVRFNRLTSWTHRDGDHTLVKNEFNVAHQYHRIVSIGDGRNAREDVYKFSGNPNVPNTWHVKGFVDIWVHKNDKSQGTGVHLEVISTKNDKGRWEAEIPYIEQIPDQKMTDGVSIKPIYISLKGGLESTSEDVIDFTVRGLPKGLTFDRQKLCITGTPTCEWREDEGALRDYVVGIEAKTKKGLPLSFRVFQNFRITLNRIVIPQNPTIKTYGSWYVTDKQQMDPIQIVVQQGLYFNKLINFRVKGLPKGVFMSGLHFIMGTPDIDDWKPSEEERVFDVYIEGDVEGLTDAVVSHRVGMVVKNTGASYLTLLPIGDQVVINGKQIEEIPVKFANSLEEHPAFEMSGNPPGVGKFVSEIFGRPDVQDWADGEKSRDYIITLSANIPHVHPEQKTTTSFKMTVMNNKEEGSSMPKAPTAEPTAEPTPEDKDKKTPEPTPTDTDKKTPEPTPTDTDKKTPEPTPKDKDKKTPEPTPKDKDKKTPEPTPKDKDKKTPEPTPSDDPPTEIYDFPPEEPGSTDPLSESKEIPEPREGLSIGIALYDESKDQQEQYQGIVFGLSRMGYYVGDNLKVKVLNALGDPVKAKENAKIFAKDRLSLIISLGEPMSKIAHKALAGKTPLIFLDVDDPIAAGLSKKTGLGRGPVTGISNAPVAASLLRDCLEIHPNASCVALLHPTKAVIKSFQKEASERGLIAKAEVVTNESTLVKQGKRLLEEADFLIIGYSLDSPETLAQLVEAAREAAKPLYGVRIEQLEEGFTAVYAPNQFDLGTQGGTLAADVLNGLKVAKFPFIHVEHRLCYCSTAEFDTLRLTMPDDGISMITSK